MDKNQGYSILKAVMLENGRGFALGHHPTAPSPYVTWACYDDKNGQRQYEWGHYGNDLAAMEQDFSDRVKDYQRLYHVGIVQTEAPVISELSRKNDNRPLSIAQQMKEAGALAEASQGDPIHKKKAPDRGDR